MVRYCESGTYAPMQIQTRGSPRSHKLIRIRTPQTEELAVFRSKGTRNEAPVSEILSLMPPDQGAAVTFRRSLLFSKRGGIWFQSSTQQLPGHSSTSFSDHHKADSGIPNLDSFPAARLTVSLSTLARSRVLIGESDIQSLFRKETSAHAFNRA